MKTPKIPILCAILMLLVLCTDCTHRKNNKISDSRPRTGQTVDVVVKNACGAAPAFKNINITKMGTKLKYSGRSFSLDCGVLIVHNEIIEVSVRPMFGIEIYRLHLTPEKVYVFDKFNKRYCENDYNYFRYEFGFDVDYQSIEALLTNRLFALGRGTSMTVLKDHFNMVTDTVHYVLSAGVSTKDKNKKWTHTFELRPDYTIAKTALSEARLGERLSFTYDKYEHVGNLYFPQHMAVAYRSGLDLNTVDFNIQKITVDDKKATKTTIDFSRYEKQNCSKILPL